MNKFLVPLCYFSLAIFIFEVMNWYGTKYINPTWINISKYAFYTLPFQFLAYVFLIWGLNLGFAVAENVWSLILITTTITWFIKLCTAYLFFQTVPTKGKLVALACLVVANFVEKLWK